GSGKGTLCKRLSEEYGFSHLSVGDLMRGLLSSPSVDTEFIDSVKSGKLVSVEALAPILKSQIEKEKQRGQTKILVDGFPRRLDQAVPVEALVSFLLNPVLVLFFDCPEGVTEKRFLTRNLSGREADNDWMFKKRYQEFTQLNPDIVDHYRTRGILLSVRCMKHTVSLYSDFRID
ncbi:P-loop containing nucleoside triphosphate hydrolase protein, partial [Amniculicola lignicola CBS 123094]